MDVTKDLVRGPSELVTLETFNLNGVIGANTPGTPYYFSAAAMQDERRVVQIRAITFSTLSKRLTPTEADLTRIVLTLRGPKGDYIFRDMPLIRFAQVVNGGGGNNPKAQRVRNLLQRPRYIDWRQCYITTVQSVNVDIHLDVIYEPLP